MAAKKEKLGGHIICWFVVCHQTDFISVNHGREVRGFVRGWWIGLADWPIDVKDFLDGRWLILQNVLSKIIILLVKVILHFRLCAIPR